MSRHPSSIGLAVAVALGLSSGAAAGQKSAGGALQSNGVVWCGDAPSVRLHDVVERSAPILWFSPDEPLLRSAGVKFSKTPTRLPFDSVPKEPDTPIVYFQLKWMTIGARTTDSPTFDPI